MIHDHAYEAAARHFCKLHGADPDEMVAHGADPTTEGIVHAVLLHSPRWTRVAREMRRHHEFNESLRLNPPKS